MVRQASWGRFRQVGKLVRLNLVWQAWRVTLGSVRLRLGGAGVVRYHGASHSSVSFGKAGSVW
jgi:hypothetical protein